MGDANQTMFVLIPKVKGTSSVSQFQPIYLCSAVLKIVFKVQANRLKLIIPKIPKIMLKFEFSEICVQSGMKIVTWVLFSMLFNGEKTEVFKPSSRRIHQGDPISPYLFFLAAEGLSCLLRRRGNT